MSTTIPTSDIAVLCDPGAEALSAIEVARLTGSADAREGFVRTRGDAMTIARLNYHVQTASRVLILLAEEDATLEGLDAVETLLASVDLQAYIGGPFRVSCEAEGFPLTSHEVEERLGGVIHKRGHPVSLEKPDAIVYCHIASRLIVGIDTTGRDLGKREYRAFHTHRSLRSTIAAAALIAADFEGTGSILDPYANEGVIPIEATLLALKRSPQFYQKSFAAANIPCLQLDWESTFAMFDEEQRDEAAVTGLFPVLRLLTMARSNAKLAGIAKQIRLTRCDPEWIAEKVEGVDRIVCAPPVSGKTTPLRDVERLLTQLFRGAKLCRGPVVMISEKREEVLNAAVQQEFTLTQEWAVRRGGACFRILRFGS